MIGWKHARPALAGALLAALPFLFAFGVATESRAAEPARIVFTNGSRIVTAEIGGTERKVLAGSFRYRFSGDSREDIQPVVSPDGGTVLFSRVADGVLRTSKTGLMAVDVETGRTRLVREDKRIVKDGSWAKTSRVYSSDWSPSGDRIFLVELLLFDDPTTFEYIVTSRVISIDPDGKRPRVVLSRKFASTDEVESNEALPYDLDVSPDGKSLVTSTFRMVGRSATPTIEEIDIKTGKTRVLTRRGSSPSYSPDGTSIAFASTRDKRNEQCYEDSCSYDSRIYVMDSDGGNVHPLVKRFPMGSSWAPDWSPDGTRIAFTSDWSFPVENGQGEIWIADPSGGCLAKVTNGVPSSDEAAWFPGGDAAALPCGSRGPKATVEYHIPKRAFLSKPVPLWLGPRVGNGLLSDLSFTSMGLQAAYWDCASFDRAECAPPMSTGSQEICETNLEESVMNSGLASLRRVKGGVAFAIRPGRTGRSTTFVTGPRDLTLLTQRDFDGKTASLKEHLALIGRLRKVGAKAPPRRYPAAVFSDETVKRVRTMLRVHASTGSLRKAAKRADILGIVVYNKNMAARYLRFAKAFRGLGKVKTVDCPERRGL